MFVPNNNVTYTYTGCMCVVENKKTLYSPHLPDIVLVLRGNESVIAVETHCRY
jgi:hypothetical protein